MPAEMSSMRTCGRRTETGMDSTMSVFLEKIRELMSYVGYREMHRKNK
jgi:hypothetical protein